jgi:hypothetical protein
MSDVVDVHRPVSGDVIDLILDDHRLFEELLRNLRDASSDRATVLDALATVLELKGTDTQAFNDAVEELSGTINHHLTEEELTILNPAREELGSRARSDLGAEFVKERNRQIDDNCGTVTKVRALAARGRREGKLD